MYNMTFRTARCALSYFLHISRESFKNSQSSNELNTHLINPLCKNVQVS